MRALAALAVTLATLSCAAAELEREPPRLASMEEPLTLVAEPDDEAARQELDPGGFTGVYVRDARANLEAMLSAPEGVLVDRVVENSPGEAAGLEPGDLLFEVETPGGGLVELAWPKDWRGVELAHGAGDELVVRFDRAGAELERRIAVEDRKRPAEREESRRVREERRVGVVLRTATEVEARAAGLPPGAGAVVVGLSLDSPWRAAGLRFEDLIATVDGREVGSPTALVDAIEAAPEDGRLELGFLRGGQPRELRVQVSRRARELDHVRVPLIFSYERDRDLRETSVLLGLFRWRRSPAAWDLRLFWLVSFGGGDADRLVEVDA